MIVIHLLCIWINILLNRSGDLLRIMSVHPLLVDGPAAPPWQKKDDKHLCQQRDDIRGAKKERVALHGDMSIVDKYLNTTR